MYDFGIIVNSGVTQGLMQSAFGVPTTIWMVTTAVADWCVAIALVYQLQRMKNAFKNTKRSAQSCRRSAALKLITHPCRLIRRLSINAIQSGSLSSVVATLLIMFFFIEDSNSECSHQLISGHASGHSLSPFLQSSPRSASYYRGRTP